MGGLDSGAAMLAEGSRLVYRRGEVDWSLAAGGRGASGTVPTPRGAPGGGNGGADEPTMRDPGEVGFASAPHGEASSVELEPDGPEMVCRAERLFAVEAKTRADLALARWIGEAGPRTRLAVVWLRGEGVAFLCARGRR